MLRGELRNLVQIKCKVIKSGPNKEGVFWYILSIINNFPLTSSGPEVSGSDWRLSCSWWQSWALPLFRNPCASPLPRVWARTHPGRSFGGVHPSIPGAARQTEPGADSPCLNLREMAPQQTTCARLQPDLRPRQLGKPARLPPGSSTASAPGGQSESREGTGNEGRHTHTHTR